MLIADEFAKACANYLKKYFTLNNKNFITAVPVIKPKYNQPGVGKFLS